MSTSLERFISLIFQQTFLHASIFLHPIIPHFRLFSFILDFRSNKILDLFLKKKGNKKNQSRTLI